MIEEEKELLISLLHKSNQNDLLHIYDNEENIYDIDWLFIDNKICIKLKQF